MVNPLARNVPVNTICAGYTVHDGDSFELALRQMKAVLGEANSRHAERLAPIEAFEADPLTGWKEQKGPKIEARDTFV
jgi:hypothetical protein